MRPAPNTHAELIERIDQLERELAYANSRNEAELKADRAVTAALASTGAPTEQAVFWKFQPFSIKFQDEEVRAYWDAVNWLQSFALSARDESTERLLTDLTLWTRQLSEQPAHRVAKGISMAAEALHQRLVRRADDRSAG